MGASIRLSTSRVVISSHRSVTRLTGRWTTSRPWPLAKEILPNIHILCRIERREGMISRRRICPDSRRLCVCIRTCRAEPGYRAQIFTGSSNSASRLKSNIKTKDGRQSSLYLRAAKQLRPAVRCRKRQPSNIDCDLNTVSSINLVAHDSSVRR